MSFVHEDREFEALLQIVARERGLAPGLIEKDYWVTHTLWALQHAGFEIWFKGGTSLSKGFGIIERFSEDLDLKIEPGRLQGLPSVSNWTSEGKKAIGGRQLYFEKLAGVLSVPGATVTLDPDLLDGRWRTADLRVTYPGRHLADLGIMSPFVRLEVGSARVTPFLPRDMTSFVHESLAGRGQLTDFDDNRPRQVRCVHPVVTLLEKLDALRRRFPNDKTEPATFVRHYEDSARIIGAIERVPALTDYPDAKALAEDLLEQRQVASLASSADPAFNPGDTPRWNAIGRASEAIAPMFWGARITVEETCRTIREWIGSALG